MNRDDVIRQDFPEQDRGYDRASVDAHMLAVAAAMEALKVRIRSGEVERDALRRNVVPSQVPPTRLPTSIAAVPHPEPVERVELPDEVEPTGVAETVDEVGPAVVGSDESGARLVAMKMALDGADRDAIKAKLDESFGLADVEGLLDDIYKRVG